MQIENRGIWKKNKDFQVEINTNRSGPEELHVDSAGVEDLIPAILLVTLYMNGSQGIFFILVYRYTVSK